MLLETWRQKGVVYIVGYKDSGGVMFVHTNAWRRITSHLQSRLALAAYCPIGSKFGSGRLDIGGRIGPVFGAVVDGRWQKRKETH
ncbi:Hypothetical protein RG1141_PB01260 (plasmid) [Neorhizobium galegae bv. officinalis bv. officinalis str. HAMBI 1141]|uniref:Uncharacterized protein n=2 Tax=Neorhizobium galegae TaxID=399 RepID=A0A068TK07_NEOGA|nr:Hypothetical protein RG1141_PB01260 [Neorhizobium galegae bv. officinalis bv. officinalis str. HAMBI 1141]